MRLRCPLLLLFVCYLHPPPTWVPLQAWRQPSLARLFFDNLQNKFAYIDFLQYLCIWKPKAEAGGIAHFYPPRVVYLIRLIVMRISNKRKTNTKIAFFIVFFGFSVFTLHHPPWCIGTHPVAGAFFIIEFVRLISSLILLRGLFHPAHADAIVRNDHCSIVPTQVVR